MKICLDLRTATSGIHGIARYGVELAKALLALRTGHQFYLLAGEKEGLGEWVIPGGTVVESPARPYSFEEQVRVPLDVARLKPHIYHCVTYACPLMVPCPMILTLHDLLPLERPDEFPPALRLYWNTCVRLAAKRARRIVTDAAISVSSINKRLSVPLHKVSAIPLGGDHIRQNEIVAHDRNRFREVNPGASPYFLSVANERPHKNILFAVKCFLESRRLREGNVLYLLVGKQHPEVYAYMEDRDRDNRIRVVEFVSEGLLRLLYQEAIALLCPSHGEGFFLPAAEAMQFGIPVIAARDGALPEVLGSSGVLLPPGISEEWEVAMSEVLEKRKRGEWNGSEVEERASIFSWEKTARLMLALYEEAVQY